MFVLINSECRLNWFGGGGNTIFRGSRQNAPPLFKPSKNVDCTDQDKFVVAVKE